MSISALTRLVASPSPLMLFLCCEPGDGVLDLPKSCDTELSAATSFVTNRLSFEGNPISSPVGAACSDGFAAREVCDSLCSRRLTKAQSKLPHILAIMPVEMALALPLPPPRRRSPATTTAVLLRLVAAGGLARVDGAKVLGGMSRSASVKPTLGFVGWVSTGIIGTLGPTGIEPWVAAIKLAIPPPTVGVEGEEGSGELLADFRCKSSFLPSLEVDSRGGSSLSKVVGLLAASTLSLDRSWPGTGSVFKRSTAAPSSAAPGSREPNIVVPNSGT